MGFKKPRLRYVVQEIHTRIWDSKTQIAIRVSRYPDANLDPDCNLGFKNPNSDMGFKKLRMRSGFRETQTRRAMVAGRPDLGRDGE